MFELFLPVVEHLAASCKETRYIILDPMIGEVKHTFKPIFNGTNKYDCHNEQQFLFVYISGFNNMEEVT